ncbi:peptide chain release factor 3, partial [mine drainage metagenome]
HHFGHAVSLCGCLFNLLDTPGHEDFSEDTYRTLSAVDSALMVIDAAKGVEERTLKLMEVARRRNTPVMTFINKMDREGLPPLTLLDEIEKKLGLLMVPFTWPIGQGRDLLGVYHLREDQISIYRKTGHEHAGVVDRIQGLSSDAGQAFLGPSAARLVEECELVRGTLPSWNRKDYEEGLATPVFFGSARRGFWSARAARCFLCLCPAAACPVEHDPYRGAGGDIPQWVCLQDPGESRSAAS